MTAGVLLRPARFALPPTMVLAIAIAVIPTRITQFVRGWLLVLLALAAIGGIAALRRAFPGASEGFDSRTRSVMGEVGSMYSPSI